MRTIKNQKLGTFNKIILECYGYKFLFLFKFSLRILLHLELPKTCYQSRIRLPHPYNIIINDKCKLGKNITIYHNVTLGSMRWGHKKGVPVINDNVIIFPSAIIIGNITIGQDSIIGAGAVVIDDVAPYSVMAGNPAKCIKVLKND